MPIAGDELFYEMGVCALLEPGAEGVPTWTPDEPGSRAAIKRPNWARDIFPDGARLNAEMGAALALWAAGARERTAGELAAAYAEAEDVATFGALERDRRAIWRATSKGDKAVLKAAADEAKARIEAAESPAPVEDEAPAYVRETPTAFDPSTGEVHPDDEPSDEDLGLQSNEEHAS